MRLHDVITRLEREDPSRVLAEGFGEPASYRGYYEQLAFSPAKCVTVGSMLTHARSAVGATFEGWKGGDYEMDGTTEVWIAERGNVAEDSLQPAELERMLAPPPNTTRLTRELAIELYRAGLVDEITTEVTAMVKRAVTAAGT